ncbi:MAG: hypothetical protein ACYSUT_07420 [Planctomycetota bacterium]|jgi:energy-coupling factor transporter ATP-binding protein EcfA2
MICAKDNPFAVDRWQRIGYIPQAETIEQIADRLKQMKYTAAIIGPHGGGKTTLLEHLEIYLRQQKMQTAKLFLNLDTKLPWREIISCVQSVPSGGVLFFDGACHLPRWRFWQLKRAVRKQSIGLVITAHSEGLLPTLTHCRSNPELLKAIVSGLLNETPPYSDDDLAELFDKNNGNLRNCLWHLYDEYVGNET